MVAKEVTKEILIQFIKKKNNYPKRIQKEMFGEKMFFQKCSFRVIGTSVGSSWAAS